MTLSPTPARRSVALAVAATLAALAAGCGSDAAPATVTGPSTAPTGPAVTVRDMWIKAADSGMSAAFGTLVNDTGADVTVVAATSTVSPMMELHEVADVDGEMVMRPKDGGFVVPAGGSHELRPGGDHLMLMDVTTPVQPGDEVRVTLTLDGGGTLVFTAVGKDFAGGNESYQPEMPGLTGPSGGVG